MRILSAITMELCNSKKFGFFERHVSMLSEIYWLYKKHMRMLSMITIELLNSKKFKFIQETYIYALKGIELELFNSETYWLYKKHMSMLSMITTESFQLCMRH